MKGTILLITLILTGLSAGFFYAWSVSAIPGLKRIDDQAYLEAMQAINRAVLNPWFFLIFFGPVVLLIWSSWLEFKAGVEWSFWLTLGATLAYLVGTFGVTAFGNVPLNEALDAVQLKGLTPEEMTRWRNSYEGPWNRLHMIRTVFSLVSFSLLALAFRH